MPRRTPPRKLGTYRRVLVSVSPAGVAHRTPWMELTTLCGIRFHADTGWTPEIAEVTCKRCLTRSRLHSTATNVL
jgi:hypothetical protein